MTQSAPEIFRRPGASRLADRGYLALTTGACLVAVLAVAYFVERMFAETGDVWARYGIWGFITGTDWVPSPATGEPLFGAMPFIAGTVSTSAIALLLATPVAVGVAIATTVILPARLRAPIAAVVDLLAAVPSVVFGIWGFLVVAPALRPFQEWLSGLGIPGFSGPVISGGTILIGGIVLAIMILPIIASITREVLATVPTDQREAAYALGATRWEMVRGSMLPWARSGIVGAGALGLGRAMGETIAVALILGGGAQNVWDSLVQPGSTLASAISNEIPEAADIQRRALVALGLIMLVVAVVINLAARAILATAERGSARVPIRQRVRGALMQREVGWVAVEAPSAPSVAPRSLAEVSRSRRVRSMLGEGYVLAAVAISLMPLGMILGTILVKGVPALSWDFFTELPPADPNDFSGGIGHAIIGSVMTLSVAVAIAAPLGILVALFISETVSAPKWVRRVARGIGFFVDVLLGMPSIVVGLVVYLGIVLVQGHFSAMAGGIALAVIMFPVVVRSADEILRLVPRQLNEAALALGAPRWRTAWSVILPFATPGLITGVMLGVARAAGETAPLLFTSNGSQLWNWFDFNAETETLPRQIYQDILTTVTPATEQRAWGAALVLVTMILAMTFTARWIARRVQTR